LREPTLRKVAYGVAMAIAIILVHFINVRIYAMPPIFALFLAIFITYLCISLIKKSDKFDQKISRTKYNLLNALVVFVLFIAYYTIAK
jgi:4-hydroxybenzoate polyprenyltransferase